MIDRVNVARNILILSLIGDNTSYSTIWNIYLHMYLDKASHAILIAQCEKLVEHSANVSTWSASPYGSFLKFATTYTLSEVRRHWCLYIAMQHLPAKRMKE